MRFIFTYPSSHHRTGGVTVLYEFANALARRDHEVTFVHGPANPHRIMSLDELPPFRFHDRIRHEIVDSLEEPVIPDADVVFHRAAPSRLGLPCVIVQGFDMLPGEWERDAYRTPAPKACVARWLVDVGRELGVPDEQLWHIPLGLDHELFTLRTPLAERTIDVAVLSHPHRNKGWDVALAALDELSAQRPELRATVFGVDQPKGTLPPELRFRSGLTHRQLVDEVYNQARVFLQASRVEGFGYTAVEAMACGCALVTTDNGGSRDYAIDGETAYVVPSEDSSGLAAGVGRLLDDPERRRQLAERGRRHVQRFDWDHSGAVLEAHLERYLQHPETYRRPARPDAPGRTG